MVAWPGEQLPFYDVIVESGSLDAYSLWDALDVTMPVDTTVTVSAGDQFYLYSDGPRLAVPGDVLGECNWIIDVVDGDAVASVETGFDPDWSYDSPAWQPTGVTALAGRVVVPLPASERSFERLWNEGAALLRITVTAGSATLRAVWLQVEPPDGLKVRSGWRWSDYVTPGEIILTADHAAGIAGTGYRLDGAYDRDAALDGARSGEGNIAPGSGPTAEEPPNSYFLSVASGDSGGLPEAVSYDRAWEQGMIPPISNAWLDVGYASGMWTERPGYRTLPEAFGAGGLRTNRDFEKIDSGFEWASYVEFAAGITEAVAWNPVGALVFHDEGVGSGIGATVGFVDSLLLEPTSGWTGSFGGWPPPLASGSTTRLEEAPTTGAPISFGSPAPGADFTVTVHGDLSNGSFYPPGDGDTGWQRWRARVNATIRYQMPDYRYRVPVFVPSPDALGLKPRFYVKHRDDTMRPVGFGKPATELTLFRVPGRGRWRDLTTDEYATFGPDNRPPGGMPLKVKRLDGGGQVWWDHVGWMIPDA